MRKGVELCGLLAQACPTLGTPKDCSQSSSSVHGISQARILEWAAFFFSRGSSQPRNRTRVSCIGGRLLHCRRILYQLSYKGSAVLKRSTLKECLIKFSRQEVVIKEGILNMIRTNCRDFPGGPVAKTLELPKQGAWFHPWSGNWIPHALT